MTQAQAETKAKQLNRFVKHPNIAYKAHEIREKIFDEDTEQTFVTCKYNVVQTFDGNIVWYM